MHGKEVEQNHITNHLFEVLFERRKTRKFSLPVMKDFGPSLIIVLTFYFLTYEMYKDSYEKYKVNFVTYTMGFH